MVKKLERNGLVAVLVSPDYGAGWSSWADEQERELMLFDPDIAQAVLAHENNPVKTQMVRDIQQVVELKSYQSYTGGLEQLRVVWMPKGAQFRVTEYDGSEGIELVSQIRWDIA